MGGHLGSRLSASTFAVFRVPAFLACLFLFLLHYFLQKGGLSLPWADAWLDDLLCMPVVLGLALTAMRLLKGEVSYQLEIRHLVITLVLFSLWFELWLPRQSALYTADPWDILAYAIGGLFYWWVIRPRTF